MQLTDETKVMRDPIHGYIHVNLKVVWDCINTKEFQRLRRIHQLGGDFQVYHTAEHTRFAHSLGVYEIVRRMVSEINQLQTMLSDYEKACVMLAGLLHDVGHGPFSHAFESVSMIKHEAYTVNIIMGDSELHRVLKQVNPMLPKDVASIIMYKHPKECLNQLISGQLDADRMDYLLRDAYFTGTSYGEFDMERIIRTIRVYDNKIVVKESGIHSVEDYIMARYHMYWQVYLHPVARSYEALLSMLFKRMNDIYQTHPEQLGIVPMFLPFLGNQEADIQALHELDEAAAFYGFALLTKHEDAVLSDISTRILNRRLFEYITLKEIKDMEHIQQHVMQLGYNPRYYIYCDAVSQKPYSPYKNTDTGHNIWILKNDNSVVELSEASDIVQALTVADLKEEKLVYYPINHIS